MRKTLTNLRDYTKRDTGIHDIAYATVDVTTGFWLWKRTCTYTAINDNIYWRFMGTGEFTPGTQMEDLVKAAKKAGEII